MGENGDPREPLETPGSRGAGRGNALRGRFGRSRQDPASRDRQGASVLGGSRDRALRVVREKDTPGQGTL